MQRRSKVRRTENGGRRRRHWEGGEWYGGEWNKEKEKGGGEEVKGRIKGEEKK